MTFLAAAFRTAESSINLQQTLAASSVQTTAPGLPHHPIACTSTLRLDEDGTFGCEHGQVPPGDQRTQSCLDHSIAILLVELLVEKEGGTP